jgi:hypothetical protein
MRWLERLRNGCYGAQRTKTVKVLDPAYSTRHPFGFVDSFAGSVVPAPLMANEFSRSLLPCTLALEKPPPIAFIVDDVLFSQLTCPAVLPVNVAL